MIASNNGDGWNNASYSCKLINIQPKSEDAIASKNVTKIGTKYYLLSKLI